MDASALAPWRDLSLVWFIFWMFLFMLLPGVAFFFAVRGMRALNRWIRKPISKAQEGASRIRDVTNRASNRIADVPIAMYSTSTRVSTTTRSLVNLLRNR